MAENSKIEWTDHTASPWYGCSKCAVGCDNCYAADMSKRNPATLGVWGDDGTRVKSKSFVANLRRWNKSAARRGVTESVFPSMCDPFEDRPELEPWRREMFAAIDECSHLRLLLLTKRPENIAKMWPWNTHMSWGGCVGDDQNKGRREHSIGTSRAFRKNVWLLTSIATQADADRNIPELLKCRDLSPVLGVSAEPLLGPVDLRRYPCRTRTIEEAGRGDNDWTVLYGDALSGFQATSYCSGTSDGPKLDWVIVGGESGHGARPMHPDWARSIRDQCQAAGVPFFFKQWGEWLPPPFTRGQVSYGRQRHEFSSDLAVYRVGKKAAGRLLDGREWSEFPSHNEVKHG